VASNKGNDMKLTAVICLLAGALAINCQAGPESRDNIKASAKETLEKAKATTREAAAEAKELAQKGAGKTKEVAHEVAEHARAGAKRVAEVSKEVAAQAREVAAETTEKVKAKLRDVKPQSSSRPADRADSN
jgi:DNA-directed RNA polymerase subunit F